AEQFGHVSQSLRRKQPDVPYCGIGHAHQIDVGFLLVDPKYADPFVILRNTRLGGALRAVADGAHTAHESAVHQRLKLLREALPFGGALPLREPKILAGFLIVSSLGRLQETEYRVVWRVPSQGIGFRRDSALLLRTWCRRLARFFCRNLAVCCRQDRQDDKGCTATKKDPHLSVLPSNAWARSGKEFQRSRWTAGEAALTPVVMQAVR